MTKPKLQMQQIIIAPWDGRNGRTYSTLALSTDGYLYRYDLHCEGWLPIPMTQVDHALTSHPSSKYDD